MLGLGGFLSLTLSFLSFGMGIGVLDVEDDNCEWLSVSGLLFCFPFPVLNLFHMKVEQDQEGTGPQP